jgi:hypothetical protein
MTLSAGESDTPLGVMVVGISGIVLSYPSHFLVAAPDAMPAALPRTLKAAPHGWKAVCAFL